MTLPVSFYNYCFCQAYSFLIFHLPLLIAFQDERRKSSLEPYALPSVSSYEKKKNDAFDKLRNNESSSGEIVSYCCLISTRYDTNIFLFYSR